jgi:hypothetical protein
LKPHWDKAASELKGKVKLGAVDATVHQRFGNFAFFFNFAPVLLKYILHIFLSALHKSMEFKATQLSNTSPRERKEIQRNTMEAELVGQALSKVTFSQLVSFTTPLFFKSF